METLTQYLGIDEHYIHSFTEYLYLEGVLKQAIAIRDTLKNVSIKHTFYALSTNTYQYSSDLEVPDHSHGDRRQLMGSKGPWTCCFACLKRSRGAAASMADAGLIIVGLHHILSILLGVDSWRKISVRNVLSRIADVRSKLCEGEETCIYSSACRFRIVPVTARLGIDEGTLYIHA